VNQFEGRILTHSAPRFSMAHELDARLELTQ